MLNFYVTGCDSGFGRDLVARLYGRGHRVFAGCLLEKTVAEMNEEFPKSSEKGCVVAVQLDVTDEESVRKAAEAIEAATDRLDGVVNNAGILLDAGPAEWSSTALFRKMLDVNVVGMSSVTKSVLCLLRPARGRIVNVASVVGHFAFPLVGTYVATKHAVEGYSDSIRQDLAPWGITVHVIEPGIFPTTGLYTDGAIFKEAITKKYEELPKEIRDAYGEGYMKSVEEILTEGLNGVLANRDRSMVPIAMEHALLNPHPKYRYRVGLDCKLLYLMSFFPEWIRDGVGRLLTRWVFGITPVPATTMPQDGLAVSSSRYSAPTRAIFTAVLVTLTITFFAWVVLCSTVRGGGPTVQG